MMIHRLLAIVTFVTLAFPAFAAGPAQAPGEVLVGLRPTANGPQAIQAIEGLVGRTIGSVPALNVIRIKLRPGLSINAAIGRLAGRAHIAYVEPNNIVHGFATPNDPAYASLQYGPKITQTNLSWDIWQPQAQTVLAIVDTGIDWNHPDLNTIIYRDGSNIPISYNALDGTSNAFDDHFHGTHCSGIAAGHINNGIGVAGIAGWNPTIAGSDTYVKLMAVKVLDSTGSGTDLSVANGITWATDHGAKVISMSLGGSGTSTTLDNACQYAWNHGVVVVAAAGNGGSSALAYPAAYNNVLSVAATDSLDKLTNFSQFGSWVDTAAPGNGVYSTLPNNNYGNLSGTSMACPHVSGEAAAILAQNPTLTNAEVVNIIVNHVDPYTPYSGRTINPAGGRINVFRAVRAAGTGLPVVTSVTVNPASVASGAVLSGTVYLGGHAPVGGVNITVTSSDPNSLSVQSPISVPEGASTATFTVTAGALTSATSVTVTASDGTNSANTTVTVRAAKLLSMTLSPNSVTGGTSTNATVKLDGAAPAGGASVTVTSNNGAAIPASPVLIPAGQTSASFTVNTNPVGANVTATLTASYNASSTVATLTVKAPAASALTLSPTSLVGGGISTATITINGPAPAAGMPVAVTSKNTAVATVSSPVTVPAGQTSTTFPVQTYSVTSTVTISITASANSVTKSANLTVQTLLTSVTIAPTSVTGGVASVGTVKIGLPADVGGVDVALSSANTGVATVPVSVNIPQGATSATFPIATYPQSANTVVAISASLQGATKSANLTVKAPVMSTITLNPTSVVGGSSSTATVTLTGFTAVDTTVTLASGNAAAQVPASVVVPAGSKSTTFAVTTTTVTVSTTASISAALGGVTKSASLTIKP